LNSNLQQVIQCIKGLGFQPSFQPNFSSILLSSGLGPGPNKMGQSGPPLLTSLTKNPKPQTKIFHYKGQDLPSLLSMWTALQRFRHWSYARVDT